MRGYVRALVFALILVVLSSAACVVPWALFAPVAAEFKSPKETFTIRLRGNLSAPKSPFFVHVVRVDALKGDVRFVKGHEIHYGDWFDEGFQDSYNGAEWLAENILHFKPNLNNPIEGVDSLLVENRSSRMVRILKVETFDLFVILELAAGTTVEMRTISQGAITDLSWVEVSGEWDDGSALEPLGMNFTIRNRKENCCKYWVQITETGVKIKEVARSAPAYPTSR